MNRSALHRCRLATAIRSAGSPRVPSCRRAGAGRSTLRSPRSAARCPRPAGRWRDRRVLSTSENRIATLAKSVSPSRQASARSPCSSLTSETLLMTLRALFVLEVLGEIRHHFGRRQRVQPGDILVGPRGLDLAEQPLEGFVVGRQNLKRRAARSQAEARRVRCGSSIARRAGGRARRHRRRRLRGGAATTTSPA